MVKLDLLEVGRHQPLFTPDATPPFDPASSPVTLLVRLAMVKADWPPKLVLLTVFSAHSSFEMALMM